MFERWGRRWECLRGHSAVEPEGWFFELWDITDGPSGELVLLARWPDSGEFTVSQYRDDLAAGIVAWFNDEARAAIAPLHVEPGDAADGGRM